MLVVNFVSLQNSRKRIVAQSKERKYIIQENKEILNKKTNNIT